MEIGALFGSNSSDDESEDDELSLDDDAPLPLLDDEELSTVTSLQHGAGILRQHCWHLEFGCCPSKPSLETHTISAQHCCAKALINSVPLVVSR